MAEVVNIPRSWPRKLYRRFFRCFIIFLELVMLLSTLTVLSMMACSIAIGKGTLAASWGNVTTIGIFGGGISFFLSFLTLLYAVHKKYKYHKRVNFFGSKDSCLQVLQLIYFPSGQCIAALLVLGSVTVIAFLVTESFLLKGKIISWIVGYIAALIACWTFIGSVAWLYFQCERSRIKRQVGGSSVQTASPSAENSNLNDIDLVEILL